MVTNHNPFLVIVRRSLVMSVFLSVNIPCANVIDLPHSNKRLRMSAIARELFSLACFVRCTSDL